ncbi:MAG: TlpA disulfide reductase family protein [Bacteroidales bacterium]|nr:TlpA disulfide reductase family protein [Bacteroidales bacterium]
MKIKNFTKSLLLFTALCFTASVFSPVSTVYGQTAAATLGIGDQVPDLKVIWVKGTPVEKFENDKLYLVEFWATWCGPCKAAMPHLSELAKKYEGKITIIGVDVWEKGYENKPYDSFLPAIKEFVASMGEKMDYNVAMDNNDLFMANNWMKAAKQNGIPASFLIKGGKIIWIGHPHYFEKTLEEVIAGTYDMEAYTATYNTNQKKSEERDAPLMKLLEDVKKAMEAKDYSLALNTIENAYVTIDPVYHSFLLPNLKFTTLLESDPSEALAFAIEWGKKTPQSKSSCAQAIGEKEGLSKEHYQFAVDAYKELLSTPSVPKPIIFSYIAKNYFRMGDIANAVDYQKQAIDSAEDAIEKGEFQGTVNNNTIREFQAVLEKYKFATK